MFKNIQTFFCKKSNKINKKGWKKPIILEWIKKDSMKKSLEILDEKIGYLLKKNAMGKLENWLLSDDINFNTLTAERYIIDYLRSKNGNIDDNLSEEGVDATLDINGEEIGIEVTTLNGFVAEWIFTERLPMYIKKIKKQFFDSYTIEIKYKPERIKNEMERNKIYEYIEKVGDNIVSNKEKELSSLDVEYRKLERKSGCISWCYNGNNEDSIVLKYLTKDLLRKLSEDKKSRQLSQYKKNLVFVGINHVGPIDWLNPGIFKEIGERGISHKESTREIQNYLKKELPDNIIGVCYYTYSLEKKDPFYRLKIFFRDKNCQIKINL
jgi:hypothetical protein